MFNLGLHRENVKKIILSETTGPRAFIFGIKNHQVDLYKVCSNYSPGAKYGPTLGVTCLQRLI